MSLGVVKNCSAFGKVTSESGDYVGGIAGNMSGSAIENCFNSGEIVNTGKPGSYAYCTAVLQVP